LKKGFLPLSPVPPEPGTRTNYEKRLKVHFSFADVFSATEKRLIQGAVDAVNEMKNRLEISDIQDIFRDNQRLFEKLVDELENDACHSRSNASQPQQKRIRPSEDKRPPKVINLKKGV
jgi:hypothetical protein